MAPSTATVVRVARLSCPARAEVNEAAGDFHLPQAGVGFTERAFQVLALKLRLWLTL